MTNQNEIIQTIADHLGLTSEDIDRQASLREDLHLGPIELNDLLNVLSVKFDLIFSSEDTEGLQSVDDLIVLVEDNLLE